MQWTCTLCGKSFNNLPTSFAADFPDNYANMKADDRDNRTVIGSDQCVIDGEDFYIRGCLEIPIEGREEPFIWGLWANLWPEDYDEIAESWCDPNRDQQYGPYKGRLANSLSQYGFNSANLKVTVKLRQAGLRPLFFAAEAEHQFAKWQSQGMQITDLKRVVERVYHPLKAVN